MSHIHTHTHTRIWHPKVELYIASSHPSADDLRDAVAAYVQQSLPLVWASPAREGLLARVRHVSSPPQVGNHQTVTLCVSMWIDFALVKWVGGRGRKTL